MSMQAGTPFYGWYGDDFTGATDTLATLSLRGVKAFLFLGPPSEQQLAQAGELDAIGIAGSARAMSPAAMEAELEPVGRFFAEAGIRLLHYKCCSTFDSASEIGNIATAMKVLRRFASRKQAFILGGQPSLGRYCAFGNLFAAAGASGVHRLDRHPTMSRHPSTPMTEADLRRHLRALGAGEIGLVPWTALDTGDITLETQADILFDALTQEHVATIGRKLNLLAQEEDSLLIVGASSVAEAVYHECPVSPPVLSAADSGPVLAVAGSLSPLTRLQVEAATSYIRIEADAERFVGEESYRERLAAKICLSLCEERNVLLCTAPQDPASISGANAKLADATGRFVDRLLHQVPVRRLVAAGGDTSSHLAQNLGLWGLAYGGQLSPGVAISIGRSDNPARDGMTLMLKGGQMGSVDLFDRFAAIPAQAAARNDQAASLSINAR